MKIHLMSDVHLEFGGPSFYVERTDADVLVLAGDITVGRDFVASDTSPRRFLGEAYIAFFEDACSKYEHVIYIAGNHEFYKGDIAKSWGDIKSALEYIENLYMLDAEFVEINGTVFFGATFWTDMGKGDPHLMLSAQYGMNDFRIVSNGPSKFTPLDATNIFSKTKLALEEVLGLYDNVVVISHHAPSFTSIDPVYVDDALNGAYASELSDFILDNPNIRLWMHGHIHANNDYFIGNTRVVSNPRGYWGHALNESFKDNLVLEV